MCVCVCIQYIYLEVVDVHLEERGGFFEFSVNGELSERLAHDCTRYLVILGREPVHKLKFKEQREIELLHLQLHHQIYVARVLFVNKRRKETNKFERHIHRESRHVRTSSLFRL